MGKLREINTKAQFAFSPVSTLIATATAAGSLSDDFSNEAKIEVYDPQLDSDDAEAFTLKSKQGVSIEAKCVSLAWGGVTPERPQGIVAVALENGAVDLWDPSAILNGVGSDTALLSHTTAHTGLVKCVDFSSVQTNLMASAGTKGEFFVWDTSKPTAAPTSYKSSRLDEIISIAWNKKVGYIVALGGKSGALSVWDLRKKSELIHIPTRFAISSIAWHPSEATILSTSSADDHNPVIQIWDLRNANAPKTSLLGHERGVLCLSWCPQDADLLLSSGSDNRTLIWNPVSAQIVAELPAASQWVHQSMWCRKQPQILANATLDGKISVFSIQDTTAPVVAAAVVETPAGDDFFDSIPKNFQAQTSSFTLKQTPKWLKRPVGARFSLGGQLAQFNLKSLKVEIATHRLTSDATSSASAIKKDLEEQSIKDLCDTERNNAKESDKQDWDVIATLTSEHARDALRTYLGFSKDELEKEVLNKFVDLSIESQKPIALDIEAADSAPPATEAMVKEHKPEEPSVFGDSAADDDDFMGIINSKIPAVELNGIVDNTESDKNGSKHVSAFKIFAQDSSEADNIITKAIFTGQFDKAIDVCLKEDRMSDAFMLALCGGDDSQKRVQEAYFRQTTVPYGRLLSSIVAGDLADVVQNADLSHWKEILAVLCNYAKPNEFLKLCELLGRRIEDDGNDEHNAVLCYLAGEKLDHLVRIWSAKLTKFEHESLSQDTATAAFEVHAKGLGAIIRKITIFRRAVSFVDTQTKIGDQYELSGLYTLYLEFAQLLASEGDFALASEYTALVPQAFSGADALKKRLAGPAEVKQPALKNTGMRQAGMRSAYAVSQPAPQLQTPQMPRAISSYAPTAPQQVPTSPGPRQAPVQNDGIQNPYAPIPMESQHQSDHSFATQAQVPSRYQPADITQPQAPYQSSGMPINGHYGQQSQSQPQVHQSHYASFAPPPPRVPSSGPTILPAAQRKDITPWNDAPDIPLPAPRRATPAVNRPSITSPFQSAATPTLQSFAPPAPQPLAPPPKNKSPAPPRPAAIAMTPAVAAGPPSQSSRPATNAYAPPPSQIAAPERSQNHAYAPSNQYQPIPAAPSIPQSPLTQQQPSISQGINHGPPPTSFAPPPRVASGPPKTSGARIPGPASISTSNASRGVNLSPEPSRQGSPVQEKHEPVPAKYPTGDRMHIPDSDKPIEQDLTNLLVRLQSVSPDKYRKPLEDTKRRLNMLYDQLNNTQLTDGTREQLRIMSVALRNLDWQRAFAIQVELTSDKIHECRDWIPATKTLVVLGKKSYEERWQ